MKQTNMRMLALCAALCLCVATAAPAYAESTRQTPRTSFVETLLDIPVLGDILRFFKLCRYPYLGHPSWSCPSYSK